jgi:hypothetical protein
VHAGFFSPPVAFRTVKLVLIVSSDHDDVYHPGSRWFAGPVVSERFVVLAGDPAGVSVELVFLEGEQNPNGSRSLLAIGTGDTLHEHKWTSFTGLLVVGSDVSSMRGGGGPWGLGTGSVAEVIDLTSDDGVVGCDAWWASHPSLTDPLNVHSARGTDPWGYLYYRPPSAEETMGHVGSASFGIDVSNLLTFGAVRALLHSQGFEPWQTAPPPKPTMEENSLFGEQTITEEGSYVVFKCFHPRPSEVDRGKWWSNCCVYSFEIFSSWVEKEALTANPKCWVCGTRMSSLAQAHPCSGPPLNVTWEQTGGRLVGQVAVAPGWVQAKHHPVPGAALRLQGRVPVGGVVPAYPGFRLSYPDDACGVTPAFPAPLHCTRCTPLHSHTHGVCVCVCILAPMFLTPRPLQRFAMALLSYALANGAVYSMDTKPATGSNTTLCISGFHPRTEAEGHTMDPGVQGGWSRVLANILELRIAGLAAHLVPLFNSLDKLIKSQVAGHIDMVALDTRATAVVTAFRPVPDLLFQELPALEPRHILTAIERCIRSQCTLYRVIPANVDLHILLASQIMVIHPDPAAQLPPRSLRCPDGENADLLVRHFLFLAPLAVRGRVYSEAAHEHHKGSDASRLTEVHADPLTLFTLHCTVNDYDIPVYLGFHGTSEMVADLILAGGFATKMCHHTHTRTHAWHGHACTCSRTPLPLRNRRNKHGDGIYLATTVTRAMLFAAQQECDGSVAVIFCAVRADSIRKFVHYGAVERTAPTRHTLHRTCHRTRDGTQPVPPVPNPSQPRPTASQPFPPLPTPSHPSQPLHSTPLHATRDGTQNTTVHVHTRGQAVTPLLRCSQR